MKYKISAVLLSSLMLSVLLMPVAFAADDGKSIIKGMVQAPADYSVSGIPANPYIILDMNRHWAIPGYIDIADRQDVYWPNWVFLRLGS